MFHLYRERQVTKLSKLKLLIKQRLQCSFFFENLRGKNAIASNYCIYLKPFANIIKTRVVHLVSKTLVRCIHEGISTFCVWKNCALVTSCPAVLAGNPLGWLPHTGVAAKGWCFCRLVFLKAICAVFFSSRITLESLGVFFKQTRGNRSLKIRRFESPVSLFRSHESWG